MFISGPLLQDALRNGDLYQPGSGCAFWPTSKRVFFFFSFLVFVLFCSKGILQPPFSLGCFTALLLPSLKCFWVLQSLAMVSMGSDIPSEFNR